MNKVVCRCAQIRESDVLKFRELYPHMTIEFVKNALNIGKGCGSCLTDNSEITDIKIEDIHINTNKIVDRNI